jgi:hypothetical protein
MQFGDWLVLYMLSANMEPMVWGELVLELQQMLKDQERQEPAHLLYLTKGISYELTDEVLRTCRNLPILANP